MSDFGRSTPREEPHGGAHDAVRDALPALLHGRVTPSERADIEEHLTGCGACDAELRTLAAARELYVAAAPTISMDRIAAAVRARTVAVEPAPRDSFVVRRGRVETADGARDAGFARRGAKLPAWTRSLAVRAFAATALLAVGSGALLRVSSGADSPHVVVASTATAGSARPAAAHEPDSSLLGASFADLSDSELAAVVAAVDDPASSTPAAEPVPVAPAVLAPDGE